jgi:hypothetical protein
MQRGKERNSSYMATVSRTAGEATAKHSTKIAAVRENQEKQEEGFLHDFLRKVNQDEKRLLKFHKGKETKH